MYIFSIRITVLTLLIGFSTLLRGQTEGEKYLFDMDRVIAEFETELRRQKVDTILQAYYLFDNGRGEKATNLFFWTKDGESFTKSIKYSSEQDYIEFPTEECNDFKNILNFYFDNIRGITGSVPKSEIIVSHNYGYYLELDINDTYFRTYLRNDRVESDRDHPRSVWVRMIHEVAKTYIFQK